jgi:AraC family transcriptional regulator of arabinose operon
MNSHEHVIMSYSDSTHCSPIPAQESYVAGTFQASGTWRTRRPAGTTDWQLVLTVRGSGRFLHPQGECRASPATVVLLRPGTAHDYGPSPGCRIWDARCVHFRAREPWLGLLDWPEICPGLMAITLPSRLQELGVALVEEIISVRAQALPFHRRLGLCLLEQLLLRLSGAIPGGAEDSRDERIRTVLALLAREEGVPVGRAVLALAVRLSPSRLSQLFRREVGISLPAYRERLRIERAAWLLDATDQSVAAVGASAGYADPFYFSSRFRRVQGMSPAQWRRRRSRAER